MLSRVASSVYGDSESFFSQNTNGSSNNQSSCISSSSRTTEEDNDEGERHFQLIFDFVQLIFHFPLCCSDTLKGEILCSDDEERLDLYSDEKMDDYCNKKKHDASYKDSTDNPKERDDVEEDNDDESTLSEKNDINNEYHDDDNDQDSEHFNTSINSIQDMKRNKSTNKKRRNTMKKIMKLIKKKDIAPPVACNINKETDDDDTIDLSNGIDGVLISTSTCSDDDRHW